MARVEGLEVKISSNTEEFDKAMKNLDKELSRTRSDARLLKNELKFKGSSMDNLNRPIANTQKQLTLTKKRQAELNAEMKRMSDASKLDTQKYTTLHNKLNTATGDANRLEAELKQLNQQKMTAVSQQIGEMGNKFKSAGETITSAGKKATAVTAAVGGIGLASAKTAMTFDSAMSEVKAITGATGKDFEQLRSTAQRLGADTAFSSQEAAQAMVEMGKAGWSTQDMLVGMDGVMDAAAASGTDLATTSTIVADAVSTFGLKASESGRAADVLAMAANAGTIGMEDLAESFKYVGPVANQLGISIEDTSAGLVALSQAGIKGSQAGTTLKNVFLRLSAPTAQVKQAIKETGLEVTNSKGEFVGMNSILTQLRQSTANMTNTQKMAIASQLAGKEAAAGLSAILKMSDEDYAKLSKSMNECSGSAERTATVMRDNLA